MNDEALLANTATSVNNAASLQERVAELLQVGGPVVMILIAMSVVAVTLLLVKLMQFHSVRIRHRQPARDALRLWKTGQQRQAVKLAGSSRNPVAQAMVRAMHGMQQGVSERCVREEVLRYGSDVLFQLRRGLRPLEVIGSLAPLLGLLGTVLGMIKAFQQLEAAGNKVNPAILSGGIWEALLTTAVGLIVAIPVVMLLNWLERRIDHLAHDMDNTVTQLFTEDLSIAAESVAQASLQNSSQQSALQKQDHHANTASLRPAEAHG